MLSVKEKKVQEGPWHVSPTVWGYHPLLRGLWVTSSVQVV